jgi:hypothetical protein
LSLAGVWLSCDLCVVAVSEVKLSRRWFVEDRSKKEACDLLRTSDVDVKREDEQRIELDMLTY